MVYKPEQHQSHEVSKHHLSHSEHGGNKLHDEARKLFKPLHQGKTHADGSQGNDSHAKGTHTGHTHSENEKAHSFQSNIIDFSSPAHQLKGIDSSATGRVAAAPAEKPHFDAKKSVEQNIKEGNFKQETDRSDATKHKAVEPGKAPKISVVYESKSDAEHAPKPNYIVNKDGSISVVRNPEGPPHDANVVIQVERDAKQTGAPDKVQQKAVDDLVEYQGARIVDKFGAALAEVQVAQGRIKRVDIDDSQNLVSDKTEQKFGEKLAPDTSKLAPPAVPVDVQHTSDLMNRVQGSGGYATVPRESTPGRHAGDGTPAGVDQMIPPRGVPQAPKEADSIAAAKDAAAALFNPDRSHPYDTIRQNLDHSYRVGRYGLNQGFTMMGLAELMGVDLGNPPDMAKLREFMKAHPEALAKAIKSYSDKVNQDADKAHLGANDPVRESVKALNSFAKSLENPSFQNQFMQFVGAMKGDGQPISQRDLATFMPKEVQELIAEKGITHEAKAMGEDPNKLSDQGAGRAALGMLLGRTPTSSDLANSQYSDYTRAGSNMYKLAESRMQSLGDINVTDAQGKIMAAADRNVGRAMWQKYLKGGRLGCAASVSAVLNEAGFSYANSINVSGLQDQLVAHGWTVSATPSPGDVVCGYRKPKGSGPGGSAHTGIVGTDGTWDNHSRSQVWSQDPLSAWNRREYPAGVVFLHPPGSR